MTPRTGIASAVRNARRHERRKIMKGECLHCRNGEPAVYEHEEGSNIGRWVHGAAICAAQVAQSRDAGWL